MKISVVPLYKRTVTKIVLTAPLGEHVIGPYEDRPKPPLEVLNIIDILSLYSVKYLFKHIYMN